MSQGFNPRPRFSLPAPLALGIEGLDEVLELDLSEAVTTDEVERALQDQLPPDIRVSSVELLPTGEKARVASVHYRAWGALPEAAIEQCAASKALWATRRDTKEIDIRPYLRSLEACDGGCVFEIRVTNEGSARPSEVIAAISGSLPDTAPPVRLVRTHVILAARQDP